MRAVEMCETPINFHAHSRPPRFFYASTASDKQCFDVGPFYVGSDRTGKDSLQRFAMFAIHGKMIPFFGCISSGRVLIFPLDYCLPGDFLYITFPDFEIE
jgi:hypothetical protein